MVLSRWGWVGQSSKHFDVGSQKWSGLCSPFFLIHPWSFMLFYPSPQTKGGDIICSWYFVFGIRPCTGFAYFAGILVLSHTLPARSKSLVLILQILLLAYVFLCILFLKPYLKSPFLFCSYGDYLYFKLLAWQNTICGLTVLQYAFMMMLIVVF